MLEILISSSVLIAVLALLRRFLRGRISARLRYALWALVLLRLLVPVTTFESKVSVAAAAEPIRVQVQQYSAQREQTVYIPVDMGELPETGEPIEAVARTFVEPLDVARWLWYAGMGAAALWFLLVNLLMARRLKKDRVYYGTHRSVPVYIVQNIPSPCLFGLLRPAIYLTEPAAADETQAARILAHEYSHLCHGDLFWALLRSLCLVIYWFDPFVWWAAALSRRDAELACDESAIAALGEEQRYEYGRTLLALATVKLRPGDLLCGATTMTGGKNSLRERIEGIARTKKLSLSLAAAALVIVALTVGCTFSGAQGEATGPAPTVTPAPVPVPTDGGLIPLNELPAGYHYGEIGPREVSIWDSKQNVAVGGIVARPTPDLPLHTGVADEDGNIEENNLNEWLKALGVPEALDYRFGSMGAGGGVGDLEMIYWTEEAFQAELGDISRRHEFFIAGDVVYDVWFDELLIDHDDILSILAAMSFPTVLSDSGSDARSSVSIGGELAEVLKTVEGASEAYMLYSQYLDDFMDPDPTRWLSWLRIENDVEKQLNLDNYHPLLSAEILSVEKINDKLFAFVARVQDNTGLPAQSIFNFLVLEPDEGSYVIRNVDGIPEELSENLDPARYDPQLLMDDGMTALGAPDPEQMAIQATLLDFTNPAFVMVSRDERYVSDGTAFADMNFEDLLFSTDSWQVDTTPRSDMSRSGTYIALFDGKGSFVIIDAERDEISFHPQSQFYAAYSIPGVSGSHYYDSLLAWASQLPQMGEDPEPVYMQFLTMALTTDYQGRYSRLAASVPDAAAYEAFYEPFKALCSADCYYTMMLNREIETPDRLAIERGYRIVPLSIEITEVNQARVISAAGAIDRWQHEFTAHCQVTTDEGLTGSATLSGYFLTDADSADAPVSGFRLTGGTVLNADPAEDILSTAVQTGTESQEITRLTIPAGCSMGQIFQLLEDNGICDKDALYETAANYAFSYNWLEDLPFGSATRLEGYLFPDTYDFYPGESAVTVIDRFLNRFHSTLTSNMYKQADDLDISLHEAVIIASLIEKEAGAGDDRSLFSSVIHNRLDDGWKLQLDSTLHYIKGTSTFDLTYDDMEIDSPYNTYLYEGLPAGPICSPGKASLEAALNPSSTNYWYWYAYEGVTHFFRSDSEFSEFVAAHP